MAKVCIALSGGVDSAVTAYLLQKQGHEVIAAFIKVWQPDFLPCSQEEDRVSAKRVAASLGIPFHVVDLCEEYRTGIVEYMIDSYKRGETPNPDVLCNKVIKFGALWDWAKQHGCTHIATGHHARVRMRGSQAQLLKAIDPAKDQSYFVWQIESSILSHVLMPVGEMLKSEVRKIASNAGLAVAARKDSQGLCFLGMVTMSEFLDHFIPKKEGAVLDGKGNTVGTHDGAHLYTLGSRHGFSVPGAQTPRYIAKISIEDNTITVSERQDEAAKTTFLVRDIVMRGDVSSRLFAQVRYHGSLVACTLERTGTTATVTFVEPVLVSPGQSCVFYDGDICLGGGIVTTQN